MRGLWATGLGLALGWFAANAAAGEFTWRPAAPLPAAPAAAALDRLVVPAPPAAPRPSPNAKVWPAAFLTAPAGKPPAVVRAQDVEVPGPDSPLVGSKLPEERLPAKLPDSPAPDKADAPKPPAPPASLPPCAPLLPPPAPAAGTSALYSPLGNDAAEACDGAVCSSEGASNDARRFYGSAEYLLWKFRDANVPVLATTSAPATAGVLGPGSTVLFGGDVDNTLRSGARFTAGYWFDPCQTTAIEGSFFFLPRDSLHGDFNSATTPVLARPFFNVGQGAESVQLTALPGVAAGTLRVDLASRLWGAEANLRRQLCCGCGYRVDLLGGFRFVDLDEDLQITEDFRTAPDFGLGNPAAERFANAHFQVFDRFQTSNQFYGGQVGVNTELRRGRWGLDLTGKVALGVTRQKVSINGDELVTFAGASAPTEFQGGLLALSSNIGTYRRDRFSVVPEVGVTVSYYLTEQLRVFAGYNFLFWSNVVRPGEQIDRQLDARRIPNFATISPGEAPNPTFIVPAKPMFQFRETTFWAQGLTAGVEYRY